MPGLSKGTSALANVTLIAFDWEQNMSMLSMSWGGSGPERRGAEIRSYKV
jgi:hypothetical protein